MINIGVVSLLVSYYDKKRKLGYCVGKIEMLEFPIIGIHIFRPKLLERDIFPNQSEIRQWVRINTMVQ
jgi:hypothetical protein